MPYGDIDIVDESRRIYNRPCSNRPELDAKGYDKTKEAVAKKSADYFACFASRVEVLDVVSQRPILADATAFRARFQTVFRESGRELQLRVLAAALERGGAVGAGQPLDALAGAVGARRALRGQRGRGGQRGA